jgi:predicted kinase
MVHREGTRCPQPPQYVTSQEMRKWMRERLKRRKNQPAAEPQKSVPAPLQPSFYNTESEATGHSEESEQPNVERIAAEQPEPDVSAPEPSTVEPTSAESTGPKPQSANGQRRRRRGRGGRGTATRRSPAPVRSPSAKLAEAAPVAAENTAVSSTASEAAVQAPTSVPQPAQRPSRGVVVLAIGLPGSGKSAWFKRHNITPLSSDLLRALLFDDATEQRYQDLIFSNLRSMLKARLIARRPMNYLDATNLTPHERHGWIKLAKDYGYETQAVFFDVPVEVCLERNRKREREVPEDVMRRMAGKLKPPAFEEGFSKITVVRVKQKQDVTP